MISTLNTKIYLHETLNSGIKVIWRCAWLPRGRVFESVLPRGGVLPKKAQNAFSILVLKYLFQLRGGGIRVFSPKYFSPPIRLRF